MCFGDRQMFHEQPILPVHHEHWVWTCSAGSPLKPAPLAAERLSHSCLPVRIPFLVVDRQSCSHSFQGLSSQWRIHGSATPPSGAQRARDFAEVQVPVRWIAGSGTRWRLSLSLLLDAQIIGASANVQLRWYGHGVTAKSCRRQAECCEVNCLNFTIEIPVPVWHSATPKYMLSFRTLPTFRLESRPLPIFKPSSTVQRDGTHRYLSNVRAPSSAIEDRPEGRLCPRCSSTNGGTDGKSSLQNEPSGSRIPKRSESRRGIRRHRTENRRAGK